MGFGESPFSSFHIGCSIDLAMVARLLDRESRMMLRIGLLCERSDGAIN
jgi:hypothetical protein